MQRRSTQNIIAFALLRIGRLGKQLGQLQVYFSQAGAVIGTKTGGIYRNQPALNLALQTVADSRNIRTDDRGYRRSQHKNLLRRI